MTIRDFFDKLKEELEFEEEIELSLETRFGDIESYDSMSVMVMIAFIDENFGKKLSSQQFLAIKTGQDLIDQIGLENFED